MARTGTRRVFRWFVSGALVTLATACRSPQVRVAERVNTLEKAWTTNLAYQAQLPDRVLDWPSALAELRANNLKLRQARLDLTNAQESVRQVFRDLIPTLNLNAGLSKRLVDLPQVGANDVTFSVDS